MAENSTRTNIRIKKPTSPSTSVHISKANSTSSFHFLGLPKEIRLIIYERLSVNIKLTYATPGIYPDHSFWGGPPWPKFYAVEKSIETSILRTCHLVYFEAQPILQRINDSLGTPPLLLTSATVPAGWSSDAVRLVNQMAGYPYTPPPLVDIDVVSEAMEKISKTVQSFMVRSTNTFERNPAIEFGIWVSPFVSRYAFIKALPGLAQDLTEHHRKRNTKFKLEIIVALRGLSIDGFEDEFRKACERMREYGVWKIVGVDSTETVDWKEHWGIDDPISLGWDFVGEHELEMSQSAYQPTLEEQQLEEIEALRAHIPQGWG